MISAKVIADSLAPNGVRLTTLSLVYPRFIHSEFMTHRAFSRNAASSRAIPIKRTLEQIRNDPAIPLLWGKNQKGMQAREQVSQEIADRALASWLAARDAVLAQMENMDSWGIHKQTANRMGEPWMLISTLVTATEWDNFANLRDHEAAQPEFQVLAQKMIVALNEHDPMELSHGDWHLPYVTEDEQEMWAGRDECQKISAARCARVSYNTHDTQGPPDPVKDLGRAEDLLKSGHMSPFEHQATSHLAADACDGNFRGWLQYRKMLHNPFEQPSKKLKKKYRLTPEEKLWMAILAKTEELKGTPVEVAEALRARNFSSTFISAYLSKHHER